MNKIFDLLYQITAIPFHISVKKFFVKSISKKRSANQFTEDSNSTTYFRSTIPLPLTPIPFAIPISYLEPHKETISRNADTFCQHSYSYLGVDANHSLKGTFEPKIQNREYSQLLSSILSDDYSLLDWQQDFQSGHRFSIDEWYRSIRYEYIPGVDAKNPIEFGRMQHLPHLIYASLLTKNDNSNHNKYINEFQNHVVDFILQNPPRFGIQWLVSMDVGIRLFNIVVAYSIAKSNDITFNPTFESILANSIVDHCQHIYNNLEWSSGMRGNHYLANLTGLLTGAMILPEEISKKNEWICFATEQLLNELLFQFQEDGSNFEDSTCYHRLSAEIELFGIVFILFLRNNNYGFTPSVLKKLAVFEKNENVYSHRLKALYSFSEAIVYDDSHKSLLQIGDDDSGQMCKLEPQLDFSSKNNALLSSQLQDIFNGYMGIRNSLVSYVVAELVSPFTLHIHQEKKQPQVFPNFGLYRYNLSNATVWFHCNSHVGQLGKGGHTHNDVLSILLSVHHQRILVDPGTFTYTPYPDIRNMFRSTSYHNTLSVEGMEQNILFKGSGHNLFWLRHKARAKTVFFDEKLIAMEHSGFGVPHRREVQFQENRIVGTDFCSISSKKHLYFHFAPECTITPLENGCLINDSVYLCVNDPKGFEIEEYDYSPQYGIKISAKRFKLCMKGKEIQWRFEW